MEMENYLSIINPHTVVVDVPAASKEEVFDYAAKALLADGVLTDAEDFKKDLYYRESLGPTGIGGGVAIPHGKSGAVAHPTGNGGRPARAGHHPVCRQPGR